MIKMETRRYRCSDLTEQSKFPALSMSREEPKFKSTIKDYEGLFINYGFRETSYPYTQQNAYTKEREKEVAAAVLENEFLYAEFLPELGGRLWRLYDKKVQKDILYTNDVIRFRNLSIRNAWFSGGVEWNCGLIGHTPFTCSPMYCAEVAGANGEEVLRFYEYERVRGIFYQIDFWLEENRLMAAARIENPNDAVVPMYWWSNIAVPECKGGRVVVPASRAYNNSDGLGIKKSPIPLDHGIDVSYPENIPDTIDYFYDIPEREQKFIAQVDSGGYGLLQWSSHRLKGRKLFSWGHRKGSEHWQNMLTDKAGNYVEIQAGLGKTQYECLPMPPKTAWSFIECYTLANLGEQAVNSPYETLIQAVKAQMDTFETSDALDSRLPEITKNISLQKGRLLVQGSGCGVLYNAPEHLEFISDSESDYWGSLESGKPLNAKSVPFPMGEKQRRILLGHQNLCDWRISYQLALLAYDERDFEKSKKLCAESMVFENNLYNQHLYAFILYQLGDERAGYFIEKCIERGTAEYSLCESLLSLLLHMERYESVIRLFARIRVHLQKMPRLRLYLSLAYLRTGDAKQAEILLMENGGLELYDVREGDRMVDALYRGIREELYGESFDCVTVPRQFDFIVADDKG